MSPVRQAIKSASPAPERAPQPKAARPISPAAALQSRIGNGGVQQLIAARLPGAPGKATAVPGAPAPSGAPSGPRLSVDTAAPGAPAPAGTAEAAVGKASAPEKGRPAADGKAKGEAGPAAAGAAATEAEPGEGGAGAAGAPVTVKLHMPEPPSRPSPATVKRIAGVKARATGKATAHAALPPGVKQVGDAQKAVTPPDAERAAAAREQLIATVNAAPSPEIVALCERIRKVIRDKRPPDEDALAEAKPEEAAAEAGGQLNATIDGETKKVEGNYGAMATSPAPAPAQPGAPIPPQPAAAETAPVNAKAAVPDPVPEGSVSLDKDAAARARRPKPPAWTSRPRSSCRAARSPRRAPRRASSTRRPRRIRPRSSPSSRTRSARPTPTWRASRCRRSRRSTASRQGTVKRTGARQEGMVGTEEQMRAKAGAEAKAAFDEAQSAVKALLKNLAPNAMAKWEAAKTVLTTQFKNDLKIVKDRVDERHSGASGFVVGLWDAVTGLPGWATDAYDRAEKNFADGVIDKLTAISAEVNSVIAACDLIITGARERIAKIFGELPASLQGWAAEEQKKFDGQLDTLHNEVIAARDAFNKDLIERSSQAVDEVRAEIAELRKKAGGLIGRIVAAVGRFLDDPVKFIIEGLLELLGIAPAAFWAVVAKIKKVVRDIIDDPMGFANNLMKGLGQGFSQFFDNFGTHLIKGFLGWLSRRSFEGRADPQGFLAEEHRHLLPADHGHHLAQYPQDPGEERSARRTSRSSRRSTRSSSLLIEKGPEGIFEMIKEKLDPQAIVDQVISMRDRLHGDGDRQAGGGAPAAAVQPRRRDPAGDRGDLPRPQMGVPERCAGFSR